MPEMNPHAPAADEDVRDFAETHDVSPDAARELIQRYGADSEDLVAALRNRNAH